jgi:hypothetical protein
MPFLQAIDAVDKYFDGTEDRLARCARPHWFTTPLSGYGEINTLFGSSEENAKWVSLMSGDKPDINQVAGEEHKIAFLTAARMDLRKQYVALDDKQRTPLDVRRYAALQLRWQRNNIRRLRALVVGERSKPITS